MKHCLKEVKISYLHLLICNELQSITQWEVAHRRKKKKKKNKTPVIFPLKRRASTMRMCVLVQLLVPLCFPPRWLAAVVAYARAESAAAIIAAAPPALTPAQPVQPGIVRTRHTAHHPHHQAWDQSKVLGQNFLSLGL